MMARVIKSERGSDMLVDEMQYMYHRHSKNNSGTIIYWECSLRKQKKCKARLHTKTLIEDVEILKYVNEHNHSATKDVVEAKSAQITLKATSATSHQSSRVLVSQAAATFNEATLSQLPSVSTISRSVQKWRQKKANFPAVPMSRTGYAIPQEFTVLDSGERFLQYDSGLNDENRMLIFVTAMRMEDLKRFPNWAIDGTFKVAPEIFYQLLTIHVQKDHLSIPRAFILLPNKTESTYRECYEKIKELLDNRQPQNIMIDFERASINALKYVYPNAILSGCFFHFSKSLYSKVVDLGYKQQYHNDNAFSLF